MLKIKTGQKLVCKGKAGIVMVVEKCDSDKHTLIAHAFIDGEVRSSLIIENEPVEYLGAIEGIAEDFYECFPDESVMDCVLRNALEGETNVKH